MSDRHVSLTGDHSCQFRTVGRSPPSNEARISIDPADRHCPVTTLTWQRGRGGSGNRKPASLRAGRAGRAESMRATLCPKEHHTKEMGRDGSAWCCLRFARPSGLKRHALSGETVAATPCSGCSLCMMCPLTFRWTLPACFPARAAQKETQD